MQTHQLEDTSVQLYTAITAGRDRMRNDIPVFSGHDRFRDPRLNAKIYKVLPHLFLGTEWSIWVDGHIAVYTSAQELVELAEGHDVAVFPHPWRNCIYEEAEECIRLDLDDPKTIREQVARYRRAGYPAQNGLAACGVIVRRHTPRVKRLCEQWWSEICRGSVRDQISFPYVFREYFTFRENLEDNLLVQRLRHLESRPCLLRRAVGALRSRTFPSRRAIRAGISESHEENNYCAGTASYE